MGHSRLIYAGASNSGEPIYRVEGVIDKWFIIRDGKLVSVQVIDDGANLVYFTGDKVYFEHDYYTFTGLKGDHQSKLNVFEAASVPVIGKYGLFMFSKVLQEASKHMGVNFVNTPQKADIIHLHQVGDINIPPEFEGKKIVMQFHGFKPKNFDRYKDTVSEFIFISDYQRKKIFEYPGGHIVWNAILPAKKLSRYQMYNFLFAQAGYDEKNVEWIQQNVTQSKGYLVVTAGEINIEGADNYGYLPMDELHMLHASSQILVLPSTKEAFGLAPLYAMLQGTAPAVSVHSGIAEVLPQDISIIFDPDNTTLDDIWQEYKAKKLYEKEDKIREHALQFTPSRWAEKIMEIFADISSKL